MRIKSYFSSVLEWMKVTQLCPTVCDSMNCTVHGIVQARILEQVAFPFSKGSPLPRDWTQVSRIAVGIFTRNLFLLKCSATREASSVLATGKILKTSLITEFVPASLSSVRWLLFPWPQDGQFVPRHYDQVCFRQSLVPAGAVLSIWRENSFLSGFTLQISACISLL